MMKKGIVIMMALLYLVTATGFALNLHYCGNHVAAVQINAPAKACGTPMAKMKMNCCKNSKLDVKVKDSHQSEQTSFIAKVFAVAIPKFNLSSYLFAAPKLQALKFSEKNPPDKILNSISILAKDCFIRI
ncbi:hypothetical protein FFF34_011475 [Inquilinus sp. KBS0705]|nr:hypothetical protein FFF34_011475 [Inquilinus sp. KBS0705]